LLRESARRTLSGEWWLTTPKIQLTFNTSKKSKPLQQLLGLLHSKDILQHVYMTAFSDKAYSLTRPLLISATSWSRSACRCLLAGNACVVTRDVPGAIECNTNCVLYSFITASCVQSAKHWLLLFAESNSGFWTFCKHTQNSRSSHRDGSARLGRGDRTTFYTMF